MAAQVMLLTVNRTARGCPPKRLSFELTCDRCRNFTPDLRARGDELLLVGNAAQLFSLGQF
jgi:hypothetical protein